MNANYWKNVERQLEAFQMMKRYERELSLAKAAGFIPYVSGNKATLNIKHKNWKARYNTLKKKTGINILNNF